MTLSFVFSLLVLIFLATSCGFYVGFKLGLKHQQPVALPCDELDRLHRKGVSDFLAKLSISPMQFIERKPQERVH